ncbi:uncharacterized protein LOC111922149 [Cyanistes caeruleus]|uniref:uncharacterized protein LOC111922149 n=1 Tax=Cyanistes caeruleus TaxID=156563 RepID=UPI000CDB47AF|nr:uncharacterized protein LOC111922149 [Cyanistes caeruleus]
MEITRSRLEGQVGTAMQAKELIIEDVRGLRCELQAVRSFSKQQCEEMAQQLRLAEEQFSKALRLWQSEQSAQEEEKRKLLQKQERRLKQQRLKVLEQREHFLAEVQREQEKRVLEMKQETAVMQPEEEKMGTRAGQDAKRMPRVFGRFWGSLWALLLQTLCVWVGLCLSWPLVNRRRRANCFWKA